MRKSWFESTGGSRSYGLSAGWLTVYQQGRVQFPVSSAISLREIRPAARTLASRSSYEGSSPSSPAKSEHGMPAGASAFQADDASSTLAARSKYGSRLVAKTRRCQRRERGFESRLPLQI